MRIKLFGVFAHLARASELTVEVETPRPIREILREVVPRYDEFPDKIIMVNGKPASDETLASNEDEIKVLPVLSGG